MKNIFIQKEFGHCVNFCYANLFNDNKFISKTHLSEYGKNTIQERKMIENITRNEFSTKDLFSSQSKPIENYIPVFEYNVNEVIGASPEEKYYASYVIGVDSKTRIGKIHAVLAIQEFTKHSEDSIMHILDPREEESKIVQIDSLFNIIKPYSCTALMDSDGGTPLWTYDQIKHLIPNG